MIRPLEILENKKEYTTSVLYNGRCADYIKPGCIKIPRNDYICIIYEAGQNVMPSQYTENFIPLSVLYSGKLSNVSGNYNIPGYCLNTYNKYVATEFNRNITHFYVNTEAILIYDYKDENFSYFHWKPDESVASDGYYLFEDNTFTILVSKELDVLQRKKSSRFFDKIWDFLYKITKINNILTTFPFLKYKIIY